jgi:putative heme-binding domain-containing protein
MRQTRSDTDLVADGEGPLALKALWALYVSRGFDDELAIELLGHQNEDVRAWTVRLLGDECEVSAKVAGRLVQLARDETSVIVRSQLACTAKRLPAGSALPIVAQLLLQDDDDGDPFIPLLLWWAVEDKAISEPDLVLEHIVDRQSWQRPLLGKAIAGRLARRFAAENNDEGYANCARLLATAPGAAEIDLLLREMEREFQGRRLDRIPPAMEAPLAELWEKGPPNPALVQFMLRLGSPAALRGALELIADRTAATDDRIALLSAVGESGQNDCVPVLLALLDDQEPASIRTAALAGLGRYEDDRIAPSVLAKYLSLEPDLRDRARVMLYGRKKWSLALLQAVDAGNIAPQEITSHELRQLLAHQDASIGQFIEKHWGKVRDTPPKQLQKRMLEIAELLERQTVDSKRGKEVYAKRCGICHKLNGEGLDIGPDLTSYPRHDLGYLLSSVIDPNSVIRPQYQVHVVITDDGLTLTGLLAESTPKTMTILDAKNQRTVIARDEIDEMQTSDLSLMPEKVLDEFTPQEMGDLFAYLQAGTDRPPDKSLSTLSLATSTFTSSGEEWTIADNGPGQTPVFRLSGGNPGGWIELNDETGGKMAAVAPRKFLGDLTRFHDGELVFDARTVDSRGGSDHTRFGEIAITGAGRAVRADVAPGRAVPGAQWTTYRAQLTADTFATSPEVWRSILADVTGIAITAEAYASSNETMGLDNVMLHGP